jgi:hypothetical protein
LVGKAKIQKSDVGPVLPKQFDSLFTGSCFTHKAHVALGVYNRGYPFAQ